MLKKISLITAAVCISGTTLFGASAFAPKTTSKYNVYNQKHEAYYEDHKIVEVQDNLDTELVKPLQNPSSRYNGEETNVFRNSYVSISIAQNSSDTENIFGVQPVGELVGEDGQELQIRYGTYVNNANSNLPMSRVFGYMWTNTEKNNEIGIGLGGEMIGRPFDSLKLDFILGGQIGYGKQFVSGDRTNISTSMNKLSYVTDAGILNPTTITYNEDTSVLDIALTLGATYEFSKRTSFDLAYVYKYNQYQVDYTTDENTNVQNNMSFRQGNNQIKFAINYKF